MISVISFNKSALWFHINLFIHSHIQKLFIGKLPVSFRIMLPEYKLFYFTSKIHIDHLGRKKEKAKL